MHAGEWKVILSAVGRLVFMVLVGYLTVRKG